MRFLDWHGPQTAKLIRAQKKIIAHGDVVRRERGIRKAMEPLVWRAEDLQCGCPGRRASNGCGDKKRDLDERCDKRDRQADPNPRPHE